MSKLPPYKHNKVKLGAFRSEPVKHWICLEAVAEVAYAIDTYGYSRENDDRLRAALRELYELPDNEDSTK